MPPVILRVLILFAVACCLAACSTPAAIGVHGPCAPNLVSLSVGF
jgi:hypothetical protein